MNTEYLRSFLEVAANGSFSVAASRLNLAQSTVSARIRGLEENLGQALFLRESDGIKLTGAGRQFLHHGSTILRAWEQARQDIAVPEGYEALLRLTAPVNFWDRIITSWLPWMRAHQPRVALRLDGSFPDTVMDYLAEGLLDICLIYLPRPRPGVIVEPLVDEEVVLVRHAAASGPWWENYILVDWGAEFRAEHDRAFPGMAAPPVSTGLVFVGLRYILDEKAAGYLPLNVAADAIERGELRRIPDAPVFRRSVFMAYPATPERSDAMEAALSGLRLLAKDWPAARA